MLKLLKVKVENAFQKGRLRHGEGIEKGNLGRSNRALSIKFGVKVVQKGTAKKEEENR